MIKYFSSFSGIGGFELGIGQAVDAECVGYSEIEPHAISVYERHFNHKNYGDITKIKADTIPDHDIFVGGFPCQAFSVAGKRKGFDDTRGTLFFEIARILSAKRPQLFLLENVKGLLSHDNGRTFEIIITTLDELGYDLQWQVLNSKNFGVPQNRERVFVVGHLRGTRRPEVFPIQRIHGVFDSANEPKRGRTQAVVSPTLKAAGNMKADDAFVIDASYPSRVRRYNKVVPTIRDYGSGGNKMPMVNAIRRLTPTECERLQGFPDGWTAGLADSHRYKCLGNAVTVNVIKAIAERIWKK